MKRTAKTPLLEAWSASRIFTFEDCPQKLAFSLDRSIPKTEPLPGSPLAEGKRIHGEGEAYLRDQEPEVPASFRYFEKELRALKKAGAVPEEQWAFTEKWEPCDWYAPEVWCRMVLDAHVAKKTTLRLVDFKTGRPRDKDEAQLDLYALGAFLRFPGLRKVKGELWYTARDEDVLAEYTLQDVPRLRAEWESRARPALDATEFPAKPGPPGRWPCAFCEYSKKRGGPCTAG